MRAVALAVLVGAALGVAGQTGSDLHPGMLILPALLLTAVVAATAAVAEDGVRTALRDVGWRGA